MSDNAENVDDFLRWCRDEKGLTPASMYTYTNGLRRFVAQLDVPMHEVTHEHVQAWVSRPQDRPATRRRKLAEIRSMFRWLVAKGRVDVDPCVLVVVPKVHNSNPRPINDDVWRALWGHEGLTRPALVTLGLGYYAGLRRVEMVAVAPHMVEPLSQRLIDFPRKGGGDDILDYGQCVGVVADHLPQLMPAPERFLVALHEQAELRKGMATLLPWGDTRPATEAARKRHVLPEGACDPEQINERVRGWIKQAGVAPFTPHALRHSFVTNLLRCGVPLHITSRMANHADVTTTMRYVKAGGQELAAWRKDQ